MDVDVNRIETGERVWVNCTPEEYHAIPGYGSGAMRCFALGGNLAFYKNYVLGEGDRSDSDSLRMGRLLHSALEQPDSWQDQVTVVPTVVPEDWDLIDELNDTIPAKSTQDPIVAGEEFNFRRPLHRAMFDELKQRAVADGNEWMTEDDRERIRLQIAAIFDNPECARLMENRTSLNVEVTCVYRHPSGILLKALIDLMADSIIDYKSTEASDPHGFVKQARRLGYKYQAAHYCLVTGRDDFTFVSVRNKPLYESHPFKVPRSQLQKAIDTIDTSVGVLSQQMSMAAIEDVDSQGIPLNWHTELWGSMLPLDEEMLYMEGLDG